MEGVYRKCSSKTSLVSVLVCILWLSCVQGKTYQELDDATTLGSNSVSRLLTGWRQRARRAAPTSVWSSWSRWSTCSRTCGGGSSVRTRHCISRIPMRYMTSVRICPGESREYRSCNIKDCPADQQDYRSAQCAVYNERDTQGRLIREWLPMFNALEECELVCHTADGAYMYTFGRVLDGTRCRFSGRDMCITGKCVKVGCDGVLYSNATIDSCGVCGGRNSTCGHVRDIYTDEYPTAGYYTYSQIVSIPAGATNITIKDRSGLNFLALKDEENHYILNGNWIINWPGSYQAAGTSFTYNRWNNGMENVVADGPIDRSVNVMIIFRERNPGVEYEYFLAPTTEETTDSINYNNEIQQLPIRPDITAAAEKRKFGTMESSRKMPTSFASPSQSTTDQERPVTNPRPSMGRNKPNSTKRGKKGSKKPKREKCGKCKRIKGRAEHYCRSTFALLVEVIDQATIDGETRYDVTIIQTFKNTVHMSRREYLWVPNTCPCPKLRTNGRYIVTGQRGTSPSTGESRLLLERENLVVKLKPGLVESWDRLQGKERSVCQKFQ